MKGWRIAVMVALGVISGCESLVSAPGAQWPWDDDSFCKTDECSNKEAIFAYIKASKFCRKVQNYYESGGQRANNSKLAVGVVGTLAGAVAAPITNGSVSTAWSGLSGATNAVQASFDDAFSSSLAVNRRVAIVAAAAAGDQFFQSQSNNNRRVEAAVSMAAACANASALADQKALQSLSQAPVTQQLLQKQSQDQSVNFGSDPAATSR